MDESGAELYESAGDASRLTVTSGTTAAAVPGGLPVYRSCSSHGEPHGDG